MLAHSRQRPLPSFIPSVTHSIVARIALVLVLSVVITMIATYSLAQIVILTSFRRLEALEFNNGIERAGRQIQADMNQLSSSNRDWTTWDDSYQFLTGSRPDFWFANMTPGILQNLELDEVLFLNTQGRLVAGMAIDESSGHRMDVPLDLLDYVAKEVPVAASMTGADGWQGIALTRHGPMLISAHAAMHTDRSGPPAGVIVFTRLLTGTRIQKLAHDSNQDFTILPFGQADASDSAQQAMAALKSGSSSVTQLIDDGNALVYSALGGPGGDPTLLLQFHFRRDSFVEGKRSILYFLGALLISGSAIGVATLLILKSRVLARLASLDEQVGHIQPDCASDTTISLPGDDELSRLANVINTMLATLRSASAKLRQARDEALEASRLKTQILANVSHDARTPMSIIRLRAQMMQTGVYGPLNDKQIEALVSIVSSSDQMLFFVNNLLDASALTNNSLKLKPTEFEPQALIDKSVIPLQILAKQKQLSLRGTVAPEMPRLMHGDFSRLTQIIFNLVGNALKFTEQGSVEVAIGRAGADEWRIEIRDTGIGIPEAEVGKLFEAFYQVDGSTNRQNRSGVGLGLSIVKQLTDLMHGQVKVTSTVGAGSTFTVILPFLEPALELEEAAPITAVATYN